MARLRVTQVRSLVGAPKRQRATVRALGLKRIRHSIVKEDRPEIRGMIARVAHLVDVKEVKS
jgi:large subunit ribosomal protein L30